MPKKTFVWLSIMLGASCVHAALPSQGCRLLAGRHTNHLILSMRRRMSTPRSYESMLASYGYEAELALKREDYKEALSAYEKMLAICKEHLDPYDLRKADIYHRMGIVYAKLKAWNDALLFFERARSIFYHHGHAAMADVLFNIGNIYSEQKKYSLAIDKWNKALSIYEGKSSLMKNTVATYVNLGCCYGSLGDFDTSIDMLQNACALHVIHDLPEGSLSLLMYKNIGVAYAAQGNYGLAKQFFSEAIDVARETLNEEQQKKLHYVIEKSLNSERR